MERALDDNRDTDNFGSKVYVEIPNLHKHIFTLWWDNDCVNLTKEEAKALIPILQEWIVSQ